MNAAILRTIDRNRQATVLLEDVVRIFIDLLIASGASLKSIDDAMSKAVVGAKESKPTTTFTELGSLQRDCMEVMCTWRRDVAMVGVDGEPTRLTEMAGDTSFEALCIKASCKNPAAEILKVLLEFGAVSIDVEGKIASETPTFLLGRAALGGRLATDGLLKQLEGYLQTVHHNVSSVSGEGKLRFERACTVAVAVELKPIFERLVRTRGQEFIDSIDEWLERNSRHESVSGAYVELGAGAYFVDLGTRVTREIST